MFAGFCPNCGAPMKTEFLGVCPYCGYDVVDDEMGEYRVCPYCGEYIEKNIAGEFPDLCPVCGQLLDSDAVSVSPGERYLPDCDNGLDEDKQAALDAQVVPDEEPVEEVRQCPWCGKYVEKDFGGDFPANCPYCGHSMAEEVNPTLYTEKTISPEKKFAPQPKTIREPGPTYDPPVAEKALMKLSACDKRDRKYGIILWGYILLIIVGIFFMVLNDIIAYWWWIKCLFVSGLGWAGYKILRHAAMEGLTSRTFKGFWVWVFLFFPLVSFGAYSQIESYCFIAPAYPTAVAYAEQGEWMKAMLALGPYSGYSTSYKSLYGFCRTREHIEYGGTEPADFTVANLPKDLQALGHQTEDEMRVLGKYDRAVKSYEDIGKKPFVLQEDAWKALIAGLNEYQDSDLPPRLAEEAPKNRQKWLNEYNEYMAQMDEIRQKAAVSNAREKARQEAEQAKFRAKEKREKRSTAYWRQRKAEEDYSRGYDDGHFAYSEGFHDMPSDGDESEEYMNGFEDAQQEAAEEEADEKRSRL